jgi:pSer/pThr/pTyr-binding forkhead associated (FHA) protein
VLQHERGQWWLRDLGSSNGTQLNGESVRAVVAVRHGDVLQCGRVRFRFISSTAVPIDYATA